MLNRTTTIDQVQSKSPKLKTETFESIFTRIRTDEKLKSAKQSLNSIYGDENRQQYKRDNFPAFFPSVWLYQTLQNTLTNDAIPTSLIQFDIDAKDNDTDLEEVKKGLMLIPELVYIFRSPNDGLKFALKTDFHRHVGESIESLKERYRMAYDIAEAYVLEKVPELILDRSVGTLKFACFLSHDPDAYFNETCHHLELDNRCFSSRNPREKIQTVVTIDSDYIEHVLSFIPSDFSYNERLPINSAVFNTIKDAGIGMLERHWTTKNREKLKSDLAYQARNPENRTNHSFGYVIHVARKYGFPNAKTGKARKKLTTHHIILDANNTGQFIEKLKTLAQAKDEIRDAVNYFIKKKEDMLISSSVGIGKTENVLQVLKQLPWNVRVLYVSNNHELLAELKERFDSMVSAKDRKNKTHFGIAHIQGKSRLCENGAVKESYGTITIPYKQCLYDCPFSAECKYTQQFNTLSSIRLAVADELFNDQAYFSNWKPDFIIVDESCLKLETHSESLTSEWKSVQKIILDCEDMSLRDACDKHFSSVIKDCSEMDRQKVSFTSMKQYINAVMQSKPSSEILKAIRDYLISGDDDYLKGLRIVKNTLRLSRVRSIHDRFKSVPKLFLDATANEKVMKNLYPTIKYVSVHAIKEETTRLIQAENFNVTKTKLENKESRTKLVEGLKRLINDEGYKNVGLITYKNLKSQQDFDEWLGNEIGASVVEHFGNLRGKNTFSNVDCLFVIGRHLLDKNGLDDWTHAVFNKPAPSFRETEMVQLPVRMNNDKWVSIENLIYHDDDVECLKRHLCQSETLQAIGRSRWFNNIEKDVYLFSNESLGTDYVVDEWMRWEDVFEVSKVVDKRTTAQKKSDSHKMHNHSKREKILAYRNFPDVRDHYKSFEEIGFGMSFSRNKNARHDFMIESGYKLVEDVWTLNT